MATPEKPTATTVAADKPVEKMVRCTVVSNYGAARPGDVITVTEREYNRLRRPRIGEDGEPVKGKWTYPVLLSAEHQQKLEEEKRAEEEARARANQSADSATTAKGWADFEREALSLKLNQDKQRLQSAAAALTPQ